MSFPESERVLYKSNPLVEVICQLRFPTILRIAAGQLADFQDLIREDYPLYSLQEPSVEFPQLPREFATMLDQINFPIPPSPPTHRFYTKDKKRFISLSQDFLALAEAKYERWETFRCELEKAERALQRVYKPAFYTRMGLRYRDVISRKGLGLNNARWQELLKPHILAELGAEEVSDDIVRIRTRTVINITSEVPGGQITLTHGLTKQPEDREECYVIDADFSAERKEGLGGTFETLDKFNRLAGRLFRWAITEKLHMAMGPARI